jgi:hypothetical protein
MKRVLRRGAGALTALTASTALTVLGTGTAHAAAYDNTDPASTGCANTAETVASAAIYDSSGTAKLGYIELRYSTACQTVWARVTTYGGYVPGDHGAADATIHRNSDGAELTASFSYAGQTSVYTNQLNDAGVTSYAYGDIDDGVNFDSAATSSY